MCITNSCINMSSEKDDFRWNVLQRLLHCPLNVSQVLKLSATDRARIAVDLYLTTAGECTTTAAAANIISYYIEYGRNPVLFDNYIVIWEFA